MRTAHKSLVGGLAALVLVTAAGRTGAHAQELTSPEPMDTVRRGLSSYGALTVPGGHFTVDVSAGYPYLLETRATVGVPGLYPLGLDFTVGFRTLLTTWEFLAGGKVRLVRFDPFSLAVLGQLSGGGGASGRSELGAQIGAVGSLTFNELVTVSVRGYLDVWSDRLCKEPAMNMAYSDAGPDVCTGRAGSQDLERARELAGASYPSERDGGARFILSLVLEAGVTEGTSLFGVFEGAPFQDARAAHDQLFNDPLFLGDDPIYNFRLGLTFKF